jgi:hypothetical protein
VRGVVRGLVEKQEGRELQVTTIELNKGKCGLKCSLATKGI